MIPLLERFGAVPQPFRFEFADAVLVSVVYENVSATQVLVVGQNQSLVRCSAQESSSASSADLAVGGAGAVVQFEGTHQQRVALFPYCQGIRSGSTMLATGSRPCP